MEEKSRIDWKAGDTAAIKPGWYRFGTIFKVLGPAVFLKQWWVPIEDPDKEDPDFHKEAGLEKLELRDTYIPTSLRPVVEKEKLPRELMYGIGQLTEHPGEMDMWEGPNPILLDMLETPGRNSNSVIIEFAVNGRDNLLYRWCSCETCWEKALSQELYIKKEDL